MRLLKEHRFPASTANLVDLAFHFMRANRLENHIVQIGANDGIGNDPLRPHLRKSRHRALLIEPLPEPFAALQRLYETSSHVDVANCAISEQTGELTLYLPKDGIYGLSDQRASFHKKHFRWHAGQHRDLLAVTVPAYRLSELLQRHHIQRVDFLLIDTEGYDFRILKAALEDGIHPACLMLEIIHLPPLERRGLREMITDHGYSFIETYTEMFAYHPGLQSSTGDGEDRSL